MTARPTLGEAWPVWLKIGALGFGGPAGQIALLHREVVERRRWIDEGRFQHALGFCMVLPGPEAQQLATYLGWLLHGVRGGLVAGLLFVAPGFVVIVGLSALYVQFGQVPAVAGAMLGVKAAVVALILQALIRIGRRSLATTVSLAVAVIAFAATVLARVPFPLVILVAAVAGAAAAPRAAVAPLGVHPVAPRRRILRTLIVWLGVWLAPLALLAALFGPGSPVTAMSLFFGQLAVVSFGGAYAAMAYTAQAAVDGFGWLSARQMLDGVGLAETTPGPLVLTFVFVAFIGAWQAAPAAAGWGPALIASAAVAWAIFAPSFLWIFVGAPYVERLRRAPRVAGALNLVSAAVVGVIAAFAVWFATRLLFAEPGDLASVSWPATALVVLGLVLQFGLKRGPATLIASLALIATAAQVLDLI